MVCQFLRHSFSGLFPTNLVTNRIYICLHFSRRKLCFRFCFFLDFFFFLFFAFHLCQNQRNFCFFRLFLFRLCHAGCLPCFPAFCQMAAKSVCHFFSHKIFLRQCILRQPCFPSAPYLLKSLHSKHPHSIPYVLPPHKRSIFRSVSPAPPCLFPSDDNTFWYALLPLPHRM